MSWEVNCLNQWGVPPDCLVDSPIIPGRPSLHPCEQEHELTLSASDPRFWERAPIFWALIKPKIIYNSFWLIWHLFPALRCSFWQRDNTWIHISVAVTLLSLKSKFPTIWFFFSVIKITVSKSLVGMDFNVWNEQIILIDKKLSSYQLKQTAMWVNPSHSLKTALWL